ncbi:hypothetical protein CYY_000207 [Polysphondylium violaceum]|uniref:Uncharacterized protein n=1 Tax=Polysphondylium violaceum TaxID=133409 RepID=A0A8J4Q458_9MYCE|nr:hypothetical protein CYY_000207 [Polysphondylium violaceum]
MIDDLSSKIENIALKNTKSKECLDLLKYLYRVTINFKGKRGKSLKLNPVFIEKLTTLLIDPSTPYKVRLLTLSIVSKISYISEPQILHKNLKTFETKTLCLLFSLLALIKEPKSPLYSSTLPLLVQSVSSQDPVLRPSSIPSIVQCARLYPNSFTSSQIKSIETQLIQFLKHASLVSDIPKQSTGFFKIGSTTTTTPVTELDGSAAIEFFTVLNNSQYYTEDQTFNIYSFSMLYTWLNLYKIPPLNTQVNIESTVSTPRDNSNSNNEQQQQQQQQDTNNSSNNNNIIYRQLNSNFQNTIVTYCLRIIDQLKLKPTTGEGMSMLNNSGGSGNTSSSNLNIMKSNTASTVAGGDIDQISVFALLEAVRILDYLCCLDNNLIAKIFPTVQKAYQLHLPSSRTTNANSGPILLALLQFFVNHSHTLVYDPEPLFKAYFQTYLPKTYMNSFVAFETLNFCLENKEVLLKNTNVLSLYFPPIFKCLAWFPQSFIGEFSELLPFLISPNSFIEVFHLLLDLPLLTLSMESVLVDQKKYSSMGIDSGADVMDTAWSENRVLYNYLLRNESGVNINFWSSTTMPLLNQFCKKNPVTPRTISSCELVASLLDIYFTVLLESSDKDHISTLLPVMFERLEQLFPFEYYQNIMRESLMQHVESIFAKYPSLIVSEKDLIISVVSEGSMRTRDNVTLTLCHIIGEYTSTYYCPEITATIFSDYHEALELIAYEKINTIKMEALSNASSSSLTQTPNSLGFIQQINNTHSQISSSSSSFQSIVENIISGHNNASLHSNNQALSTHQYSVTTMLILINALTKISSRWPDSTSRVILCLMKIIGYHQYFDPQVIQRANECISLLKYPSFAASLYLCEPVQGSSFYLPQIDNSTIGLTSQDCNSSLSFILQDTSSTPSSNQSSIHPYTMK